MFGGRRKAILSDQHLSSRALGAAQIGSDYFSSDKHYASLARHIASALRGGGGEVLITGDPPADPQALSEAICNVTGVRYEVIIISCGPELTREYLERTAPVVARAKANVGAAVTPEFSVVGSPIFLFDHFDKLSDRQIEEIYKGTLNCGQMRAARILLASRDFPIRLERSALHFLKEHLAAHFCLQELRDDEAIAFLHHQLLAQPNRRIEARGFRHGILIGLAASGVMMAASIGLFLILNPTAGQIRAAPESVEQRRVISEKTSMLRPTEERVMGSEQVAAATLAEAAPKTEATPISAMTSPPPVSSTVVTPSPPVSSTVAGPPQPLSSMVAAPPPPLSSTVAASPQPLSSTVVAPPQPVIPSAIADPPADLHSSDAEIAALLSRGDAFLNSGDISSARLFYERAADAGSGPAALLLGATFDPVILGKVGARGVIADPAQALRWYRRATDLGMLEAEQRIEQLETQSFHQQDTSSR